MKKALLLAAVLGMILGSSVMAQSVIWADIRDNTTDANPFGVSNDITGTPSGPFTTWGANGGARGDGQVVYMEPAHFDGWHTGEGYPNLDGDSDRTTCDLYIYMDVNDEAAGTADVISSIGYDLNITRAAGVGEAIGSIAYTWESLWTDTNAGSDDGAGDAGDPESWLDAKAVKVPVSAVPSYDTSGGLVPINLYRIGKLHITTTERTCTPQADAVYNLHLSVNDLLITRTFETGGDADEMVSFGYAGGVADAAISGSVSGGASANPDAVIKIWVKGDFNGDGQATFGDNTAFGAVVVGGATSLDESYLGDFNGDGAATFGDNVDFGNAVIAHGGCS